MPVEHITSNGSASTCSPEKMDAFITYKRRKHARQCIDGNLHEEGSCVAVADRLLEKNMKDPCDMMLQENGNEETGLSRIRYPIAVECGQESVCGHWKNVLEHILQSIDASEGGVRSCISDALAMSPSVFTSKFKKHSTLERTAWGKEHAYQNGNLHRLGQMTRETPLSNNSGNFVKEYEQVIFDGSQKVANGETTVLAVTDQCRSVLLDVLISDKFISLCNFLCRNFQGIKADSIFDFSIINSRMKNGQYEQSSELFASDIQQVWKKFEKIGEEMIRIAKSLSNLSQACYQNQAGDSVCDAIMEWKDRELDEIGTLHKDSVDVDNIKQLPSSELDLYTNLGHTEACGLLDEISTLQKDSADADNIKQLPSSKLDLYTNLGHIEACSSQRVCICRKCGGVEADGERRLVCDGCEAIYHITCIDPPVREIPPQSWYCATCSKNGKQALEPDLSHGCEDGLHQNCMVCERHKDTKTQKCRDGVDLDMTAISSDSGETSDGSSMEVNRQQQASQRSAALRLCKLCKAGEEDNMKFKVCEHEHCPYKFYHARCLRSRQIERQNSRWYCPSCLCQRCLTDKDDDKIVLCDACDEACHIYCMVPPLTSIPKGNWYCIFCTIEIRSRHRMKLKYDEACVKKQATGNARRGSGAAGSMDMLLCAAEKLSSEEKPSAAVARRKNNR